MELKLPKLRKIDPNKPKKKKILLLSDDLRLFSGIATQSKEFVLKTLHKYDWVQLGAALNHPENGKVLDVSQDAAKETGVEDAYLKIYCTNGYGNPDIVRQLINVERPDAILHFTDPRYWIWLYQMEHEIRQMIPIFYYNIWDDLPDPLWNSPYYASCDLLMAISKQTYGINKRCLKKYGMDLPDWTFKYVPHGVSEHFKPLPKDNEKLVEFKKKYGIDNMEFVVLWNNRNIRRKQPGDLIIAFDSFVQQLPKEKRDKVCLFLHTQPVDENGTDIPEVIKNCSSGGKYVFTNPGISTEELNLYYNSGDIIVNLTSNEGFGLSTCEGMRAGLPIVVNVTGGLQDQCGFKMDGKFLTEDDYLELGSLHDVRSDYLSRLTWGEWVKPVWPSNRSLQGSPLTPYIFDDRCDFRDFGNAIKEWYDTPADERAKAGMLAHAFVNGVGNMTAEKMGETFIESMEAVFENWKPRKKFEIVKV